LRHPLQQRLLPQLPLVVQMLQPLKKQQLKKQKMNLQLSKVSALSLAETLAEA
jgi:hypothetical protein